MRIIILTQFYYPEPAEKPHDLARGLVQRGHEVQVITGVPCYPAGKVYPGYRQALVSEEKLDGVQIVRVPQLPDHSRSAWRRISYYASFALSASIIGTFKARRPDVMIVYGSGLLIGLSAWLISRLRRVPFVFDVVDLWPESVIASGMLNNGWAIRLLRKIAQFVYTKATHVTVVTNGYRQNLLRAGVSAEKVTVIHNWMPSDTYRCVEPDPLLAQRDGLADRFNIMYAGNMGPSQNLETVLEAAALLQDIKDLQFVLVGDGLAYPALVERSRELGLRNLRFLGRRSPADMPALYALADVLLVHLKPDSLSDISIPSKTFAYMASGRPVLMAVRGDAESFINETGAGLAVPPSDPERMAEAIRLFYCMPTEAREQMGQTARMVYTHEYSGDIQIGRVEALLLKVGRTAQSATRRAKKNWRAS